MFDFIYCLNKHIDTELCPTSIHPQLIHVGVLVVVCLHYKCFVYAVDVQSNALKDIEEKHTMNSGEMAQGRS